jgi:hypothetical protein
MRASVLFEQKTPCGWKTSTSKGSEPGRSWFAWWPVASVTAVSMPPMEARPGAVPIVLGDEGAASWNRSARTSRISRRAIT